MAKVVSQETFDSVVLENVVEFDMDIEDAINDAIKEFESQVRSHWLYCVITYYLYAFIIFMTRFYNEKYTVLESNGTSVRSKSLLALLYRVSILVPL